MGTLTALRERVEKLEATVAENEARHERELADQAALYTARVEGLVALIDSLSGSFGSQATARSANVATTQADMELEATMVTSECAGVVASASDAGVVCVASSSSSSPVKSSSCSPKSVSGHSSNSRSQEAKDAWKGQPEFHGEGVTCGDSNLTPVGIVAVKNSGGTLAGATGVQAVDQLNVADGEPSLLSLKSSANKEVRTERDLGGEWRVQQRRRRGTRASPRLNPHGSRRVSTKPFHVSGIALDCRLEDVVRFCTDCRVIVTGCYFIRTRVWGTQSAKLFVAESSASAVLRDGFWPEKYGVAAGRQLLPA